VLLADWLDTHAGENIRERRQHVTRRVEVGNLDKPEVLTACWKKWLMLEREVEAAEIPTFLNVDVNFYINIFKRL